MMRKLLLCLMLMFSLSASASESLLRISTRDGVTVPVYYMKQNGATATVVLLPGGAGGLGKIEGGKPSSQNFLVRSRDYFFDAKLNVAVMGRASDKDDLDYADRVSAEHLEDIRKVVDYLKRDASLPVWLVGTSRGTVSATAAAIAFGNEPFAGIVLTSSIVNYRKTGAVPSQKLSSIRIPVLVVHHENDACKWCAPHEVPSILQGLTHAPAKKLVWVRETGEPSGDFCEPMHYHGFIGAERSTIRIMTDWIKKPTM